MTMVYMASTTATGCVCSTVMSTSRGGCASGPPLVDVVHGFVRAAARKEATQQGWTVAIAVVDDGRHLLAFERLDGCAPVGAYVCIEKARTSALGRRESKQHEDMINVGRTAFPSAPALHGLLEGGIPVVVDRHVVGAVGVSGVKAGQDPQVAQAGAKTALIE